MTDTQNDFVATATAEKRLREVLEERFGSWGNDISASLTEHLLEGAEITYLPRKRSVSILLRYPEKAAQRILEPSNGKAEPTYNPDAGADIPDPVAGKDYMSDSSPVPDKPKINPAGSDLPEAAVPENSPYSKRGARFGEFQPTVTSAPEYHEDDYFTE